jgi:hypothetical protein
MLPLPWDPGGGTTTYTQGTFDVIARTTVFKQVSAGGHNYHLDSDEVHANVNQHCFFFSLGFHQP